MLLRLRRIALLVVVALPGIGCRGRSSMLMRKAQASAAALPVIDRAAPADDDDDQGPRRAGKNVNQQNWRETAVYVDGKAIAVMRFDELPVTLTPFFAQEEVSAEVEPGSH